MNQSFVGISSQTIIEFIEGFVAAVQRQVEFTSQLANTGAMFCELTHKYSANPDYEKVLIGALSKDIEEVLEDNTKRPMVKLPH